MFFYSTGLVQSVVRRCLAAMDRRYNYNQWRSQGAFGACPLPRRRTGNFLRAVDLDLLLLAMTHY